MKKNLKPTKTQKRLIKMLTENTGRHMLDSGGAYGRSWERNQGVDFLNSPSVTVDAYSAKDIGISISVFHYLSHFLTVTKESEALNKRFKVALKKGYEDDKYEMNIMEEFCAAMSNGEGYNTSEKVVNTYNYDTVLSQILQYYTFATEEGTFIALQIHGGCDARGGYTTPQIFEITGEMDYFLMSQQDVNASDISGDFQWESENSGYSFFPANNEPALKDVAVVVDGKVYNKLTGNRIQFGSHGVDAWENVEKDEETLPQFSEVRNFVKNNYMKNNVLALANAEFEHLTEEMGFYIESLVNAQIAEIESHTLELKL